MTLYEEYYKTPSFKRARKRKQGQTPIIDFDRHTTLKNIGKGRTYHLATYGCQGNEADSEAIKGIFESLGFKEAAGEETADVILLNTCVIRANAENRVFGELGRLKQYKRHNPDLLLGICGCMPQDESVMDRLLKDYPYVDIVFGTHNIHRLPEILENAVLNKERVVEVLSDEGSIVEAMPKKRAHPTKAWVNIMFGCDEFCTYCVVPYTRGKERSRSPEAILEEVDALVEEGYKEITLLGQNVNAYGRDFSARDYTFADLLNALNEKPIARVRFTTSHPNDFDDAAIAALAKGGNMMPHIHLPVQSGSNKILKKMNRKYTRESFLTLIGKLKEAIPGVSITTDLIVGFPGEEQEDFEETLSLVKESEFEGAFTFIYSPRKGTPSAKYPDHTPMDAKKERLQTLMELVNEGYKKGHERFVGEVVSVLVDGKSKQDSNMLAGYSPHNKLVHFEGDASLVGRIVDVRIVEAKTWFMKGERL